MYTLFVYTWSFDSISYLMRFGSWGTKVTNSNPRKTEFLNLYFKKNVENSIKVKRIVTYYYGNLYHYDIYFTQIDFIRKGIGTLYMILHQIQVETSVYLKAFSTLNFNAGQILQNKTHF